MTESMQLIREFCDCFISPEKARLTRIVCLMFSEHHIQSSSEQSTECAVYMLACWFVNLLLFSRMISDRWSFQSVLQLIVWLFISLHQVIEILALAHVLLFWPQLQFFPEASEVKVARKSAFGGVPFKLDYLTKPSLFEDFGFVTKVKMADRVKPEDELFLVAYPYFNVNGCSRSHLFLWQWKIKAQI